MSKNRPFRSRAASRIPYRSTRKKTPGKYILKMSFLIRSRPGLGSDIRFPQAQFSLSQSFTMGQFQWTKHVRVRYVADSGMGKRSTDCEWPKIS